MLCTVVSAPSQKSRNQSSRSSNRTEPRRMR
ncbi:hypothetical protein U0070_004127 [Myodes glareolus]|uniref:Uncharacterized protein n=1 Tax=Myodes glareolus TaxID=447135 RepID=A0AAW0KBV5_MYOGA